MSQFIVLDRKTRESLYETNSLEAAKGFADAHEEPCAIAGLVESRDCHEFLYRLVVIDEDSGQIVAEISTVDVLDAADLFCSLRIALLPQCVFKKGGAA